MTKRGDGSSLEREAVIFSNYLVGAMPTARAVELYIRVIKEQAVRVNALDQKRLRFIARHPWSVGLLDAGLSLSRSDSEVRRRLYVLFSILEAQPELHEYFLSQERPRWYGVVIAWRLFVSGVRSVGGLCFIKVASL